MPLLDALRSLLRALAPVALLWLAACTYQPGDEANPLTRKFTWFSFLGAEDMRSACTPGAPDRFRLVYNARWYEQVRIYQLGFGAPRELGQRVIGIDDLSGAKLFNPIEGGSGTSATTDLSERDYALLLRSLKESGAYRSPADTITLPSDQFYWIAASCHADVFHLTAWLYPKDDFAKLTFIGRLVALDTTRVPWNPPRPFGVPPSGDMVDPATLPNGPLSPRPWTIGVANNHLVGQVVF